MMNRRTFVSRSGVLLSALALPRLAVARPIESRWRAAREIIASGVIGNARFACAIVPISNARPMRRLPGSVHLAPASACEILDGFRYAIGDQNIVAIASTTSDNGFAMNCRLASGATIAIAAVSAQRDTSPSIRCNTGTLHIGEEAVEIEIGGHWFTAGDLAGK